MSKKSFKQNEVFQVYLNTLCNSLTENFFDRLVKIKKLKNDHHKYLINKALIDKV